MGNIIFEKLEKPEKLNASPIFVFAADALASAGIQGLGIEKNPSPHYRTRTEFLNLLRQFVEDGYIDGLLMTPGDAEILALEERIFDNSPITPIVRMNAETNIWNPRFGGYRKQYSLPFQTVPVSEAPYCDSVICNPEDYNIRLGLYSITLNNEVRADERTLNAYLQFAREVGNMKGFDHILEVFLPNVNLPGMDTVARGQYVADSIVRTMSYLRKHQRPRFIKTEYTTPEVWRELTQFDQSLTIGALGGPRQNTRKTLELAHNVVQYGGKVILFGRTIFGEDDPRLIAKSLREVLDGKMTPDEAHATFQREFRQKRT